MGIELGSGGEHIHFLERYDSDGALDPTFGTGGIATHVASSFTWYPYWRAGIALQADGKIVIGSAASAPGQPYLRCAAARFAADGSPDPTFGVGGEVLLPQTYGDFCDLQAVAIQSDGRILLSGGASVDDRLYFILQRLNADGSTDTSFDRDGRALTRVDYDGSVVTSHALAIQADGSILQAGSTGGLVFALTRHRSNGRIDRRFGGRVPGIRRGTVRTGFPGLRTAVFDGANAVAILPDGRILAGGNPGHNSTFALGRYVAAACVYDPATRGLTCG